MSIGVALAVSALLVALSAFFVAVETPLVSPQSVGWAELRDSIGLMLGTYSVQQKDTSTPLRRPRVADLPVSLKALLTTKGIETMLFFQRLPGGRGCRDIHSTSEVARFG
jgi:hypothetical protein